MIFEVIKKELLFKAVRSSGAGGQHVNKISSKIELSFSLQDSNGLSIREKELLLRKLNKKLTKEGILILTCQESRSQHKNKELVITRLFQLLSQNLIQEKKRRNTKPTRASVIKKAKNKQFHSAKKQLRKKPKID